MGRLRSAKRKGFPDNLYVNPNGYFYYRNPRSKEKRGLGHDKATAFSEARSANAVLATLTKSSLVAWVSGITQSSLKDWVPVYQKQWIEQVEPAEQTLRNNRRYLVRIQEADFAWMNLADIKTVHIAPFLDLVVEESGASTGRLIRSRLSDVFRMAETKGLIESGANPVTASYKPAYEVSRERLSLEQFILIRDTTDKVWLTNAMNLALLSAQRREDVAVTQFTDYKDAQLFVTQGKSQGRTRLQIDGRIGLKAVNLTIDDVVKQCRDNVVSRYMVHHRHSQGMGKPGARVSANGVSNAFAEARDLAGIVAAEGRTPPSFHEIRSLAERLYRKEYGAEFAQMILGHKSAKMTAEYDDLRGSGWQVISAK